MLRPRSVALHRVLLASAAIVILHLATTAHAYPVVTSVSDKLQHIAAFVALACLQDLAFPRHGVGRKVLTLMAYGVLIEAVQWFLPWRSASVLDLLADAAGIGAYWLMAICLPPLRRALR